MPSRHIALVAGVSILASLFATSASAGEAPAAPTGAGTSVPGPTAAPTPAPAPKGPTDKVTEDDLAKAQREDIRPWAKGVSPEKQKLALTLFNQANDLLRDALFVKAVEVYREALSHWDHPAIHYNLALALVNLDQPVEMYSELEKAMAYGEAPLDTDKYERALSFKLLLDKQIATVEYSIEIPGAVVTFDGREVLSDAGTWTARVRAGEHAVTAHADGFVPFQVTPKLGGGEVSRLKLRLYTDAELTRYKRRFPSWLPWTVAGAGLAVVAGSGLLHVSARSGFNDYDRAVAACAAGNPRGGCSMSGDLTSQRSTDESKQTLAIAGYAVGALVLVGGISLLVLNRPSSYRINPGAEQPPTGVVVAPMVSHEVVGLAASGAF